MALNMLRRASDTSALKSARRRPSGRADNRCKSFTSTRTLQDFQSAANIASESLGGASIWLGPEELISGRFIAHNHGFVPSNDELHLVLRFIKGKHFWQKDRMEVIDSNSGKPFAGGARIVMNSEGYVLLDKNGKTAVKCMETTDQSIPETSIVICGSRPLTPGDQPTSKKSGYYPWFKVSVDKTSDELSIELWTGSRYCELWYAEDIRKKDEVTLKGVTDDDYVCKIAEWDVVSAAESDPALMICLSVAVERLTSDMENPQDV